MSGWYEEDQIREGEEAKDDDLMLESDCRD